MSTFHNIYKALLLLFVVIYIDDAEMLTSEMHDPYTRTIDA